MAVKSFKADMARRAILNWIKTGRFKPGDQMPSEPALAKELGMNHLTLRRALAELAKEGVIRKQRRVGNFISLAEDPQFAKSVGVLLPLWLRRIPSYNAADMVLHGVHQILDVRRYSVHTLFYEEGRLWQDIGKTVIAKKMSGVLIEGSRRDDLRPLLNAGIQVVALAPDQVECATGVHWVDQDHITPFRQILEKLLRLGHRRIAILFYARMNWGTALRDTARFVLEESESAEATATIVELPNPVAEGDVYPVNLRTLEPLFAGENAPTAVVVPDEIATNAVFRFLQERHLRIPQDVSLAAFQNYAPALNPLPLTSVDSMASRRMAVTVAATMLLDLLEGRPPAGKGITVESTVRWKTSIGPVADSHHHRLVAGHRNGS